MNEDLVTLCIRVNEFIYRFKVSKHWLWIERQPSGYTMPLARLSDEEVQGQVREKIGKRDKDWNQMFIAWAVYDMATGIWDDMMLHHLIDTYESRRHSHD
jgi:hypothetical protein